jgi:hypothetical protein
MTTQQLWELEEAAYELIGQAAYTRDHGFTLAPAILERAADVQRRISEVLDAGLVITRPAGVVADDDDDAELVPWWKRRLRRALDALAQERARWTASQS